MTDELVVGATIHAPPADVYAALADVEGYVAYSDYIRDVVRRGDGSAGTRYDVVLAWWRLTYTARFCVTALDPPERIAWRLVEDLDAHGTWTLEPASVDDPAVDHATRVTLLVRYDPGTADDDAVSLPPFVPISVVVDRVRPLAEREAKRALGRFVRAVEGTSRRVPVSIRVGRDVA